MNISYKWLKNYVDIDGIAPQELSEILTNSGLEVEGLEKFESVKGGLEGIVIGKVLSCEKHPNADKLTLTKVDINTKEPLSIVCGAPNVEAGQIVPVAVVGTTLYMGDDSFVIKKSKIRGELSEGMICAEDELGLGNSHEGIMVLDDKAEIGSLEVGKLADFVILAQNPREVAADQIDDIEVEQTWMDGKRVH